jgi:hypothetical protein
MNAAERFGAGPRPSGGGFIALLEAFRASGGTAPGDIVGRLVEEHHVGDAISLAQLIHSGRAFGFSWRASLWIPMFQFDSDDLSLNPAVQQVRAGLPPPWSGWDVATWFATPNLRLNGQCPVHRVNLDPAAVRQAAQAVGRVEPALAAARRHSQEPAMQP